MNKLLSGTALAAGLLAVAAGSYAANKKTEEVRVEASSIVEKDAGRSDSGFTIKSYNISYEVSLDDLNLTTADGYAAAEKRIDNAAAAACKEIGLKHPKSTPGDDNCAKHAASDAKARLHKAVGAAKAAK
jgi:UrcA family protein